MAKTATKEKETPAKKATGKKSNVAEFPKNGKPTEETLAAGGEGAPRDPRLQDKSAPPDLEPPAGVSENAVRIFNLIKTQLTKVSFDEISDRTDFSFDESNKALKELEEAGAIDRLPELEYQINADYAAGNAKGGVGLDAGEKSEAGAESGESYDILKEVDGSKLKAAVEKQEKGNLEEEAERRTIKLPRNARLPEMEEEGAIAELEDKALSHEDCAHTKKIMNQKQETLRAEMLEIMKKNNLTKYEHGGFVIKRESKGETVKIVSVQNKEDE